VAENDVAVSIGDVISMSRIFTIVTNYLGIIVGVTKCTVTQVLSYATTFATSVIATLLIWYKMW
jgi:hypothetical protein